MLIEIILRKSVKLVLLITFPNPSRKVPISKSKTPKQIPKQVLIWSLMDEVFQSIMVKIRCLILICRTYKTVFDLWVTMVYFKVPKRLNNKNSKKR